MSYPHPTDDMVEAARGAVTGHTREDSVRTMLEAARLVDPLVPTVVLLQDRVKRQTSHIQFLEGKLRARNKEIERLRGLS